MTQAFVMRRSDGRHRVILRRGERTAYMGEYLRGNSYRESCYACPYASTERIADITLGDFWGAYQEHRDRIRELGMSDKKGISCVLTNTAKGERLFRQCQGEMRFFETHVEAIARHNAQLAHPSVRGKNVERVWRSFKKGGYAQMERDYAKDMGARRVLYLLMEKTPKRVRRAAKQALNQLRKRGD